MWSSIALLLCAVLPAPQSAVTPGPALPSPRPNVLFVVWDDAGSEDLRDLPLSNLHGLEPLGRRFDRFYTSPVCSPSRYQMLFGRYPHHAWIGKAIDTTSPSKKGAPLAEVSVAEVLHTAGYRTGFFGKWHLNTGVMVKRWEMARVHGFEAWRAGWPDNLLAASGGHYNWKRYDDSVESIEPLYSSIAVEAALENWWTNTPEPKFAVCAFFAPHEPFDPPPPELLGTFTAPNTARGNYEKSLVALDTLLGDLVRYVDFSNTYVFVFPDNGTPHQVPPPGGKYPAYKLSPHDGGIRVPLFVFGPTVVPGVDSNLVQVVDLPRTVLDLTGVRAQVGFENSISFAPALHGGASARPYAFVHRFSPDGGPAASLSLHDWAVVRSDGWKLLKYGGSELVQQSTSHQLFDLNADPFEQSPISVTTMPTLYQELLALRSEALGPNWPY